MPQLQSVLGVAGILLIAWAFSENRRAIRARPVIVGLALTLLLALLMLKVPPVRAVFVSANTVVDAISDSTRAGTSFVFGYVGGGPLPFELKTPGAEYVLALQALDRKSVV